MKVDLENQINTPLLKNSNYQKDFCNWGDRKEKLVFSRPIDKYYAKKFTGQTTYQRLN
jgi:hypothetical protein